MDILNAILEFLEHNQLFGVIVGALISGITGWLSSLNSSKRDRELSNLEAGRTEYLKALDMANGVQRILLDLYNCRTSIVEPTGEQRRKDSKGAATVEALERLFDAMSRQSDHLHVYGSPAVIKAFDELMTYAHTVFIKIGLSTYMTAKRKPDTLPEVMDTLDEKVMQLTHVIRKDLGIIGDNRLSTERIGPGWTNRIINELSKEFEVDIRKDGIVSNR